MKNPTIEEVQTIMHELDIPPALMTDITTFVPKNTVTRAEDTIKITLDFPVIKRLNAEHQFEVKFLVSKKSLVTIHYEEMEAIDRFKRQFEVASTLRKTQKGITGAHIFISLFNNLYDSALSKLDYIETKLADIESEIFKENEKFMVYEISNISKQLIAFRHTVRGHEDILRDMAQQFEDIYGNVFARDFHMIRTQYSLLQHMANTQFETMTALRETNSAMLFTKQNEVIKTLTTLAFITFPLTLFSSMFGMNTESTPIIGHPFDFWIIVGSMSIAATGFFIYFKRKGWM
jgi:magnesium transporter